MTIYIDTLFIENLIINYIILYLIAKILKIRKKYIKIFISALIGTVYTVLNVIVSTKQIIITKITLSFVMIYIAFLPKKIDDFFRILILFYLITFTFGGAIFAMTGLINNKEEIVNEEEYIIRVNYKIIIISILIAIYIIKKSFKLIKKEFNNKNIICNITIYIYNKSIKMKGLIDSGNLLLDPITKEPVIIVETRKIKKIIPKKELEEILNIMDAKNDMTNIENRYKERIRFIPFKSIGKENGFLIGVKSDKVRILIECNEIIKENIIIALYNKKITNHNKYNALIGIKLLKENN